MNRFANIRIFILAALTALLLSCAATPLVEKEPPAAAPKTDHPMAFEAGIREMADELLRRIAENILKPGGKTESLIVMNLFMDKGVGEVPEISMDIERIFMAQGARNHPNMKFSRLSYKNLDVADAVIDGDIQLSPYTDKETGDTRHYYHVRSYAADLQTKEIAAEADVWITDLDAELAPIALYRDSPFYSRGKSRPTDAARKRAAAATSAKAYFDSVEVQAMMSEAQTAYQNGEYEEARDLFSKVAQRPDGQGLLTYTGLYLANEKLGADAEAEAAFEKMIRINVEWHNTLAVKFLFKVNSVEFIDNPRLRGKYDFWLRKIGEYFQESGRCMSVAGHSSCTGKTDWNYELSYLRAEAIRNMMKAYFPNIMQRSNAFGMGANENIIGTCSDDERDALDRRVDIMLIDCGNIAGQSGS